MLLSALRALQEQASEIDVGAVTSAVPLAYKQQRQTTSMLPGVRLYPSAGPACLSAPRHKQRDPSCLTALTVCGRASTPPVKAGKVLPRLLEKEELML